MVGFKPKLGAGAAWSGQKGKQAAPHRVHGALVNSGGNWGSKRPWLAQRVIKSTRDVECPVTDQWKLSVEHTPSFLYELINAEVTPRSLLTQSQGRW